MNLKWGKVHIGWKIMKFLRNKRHIYIGKTYALIVIENDIKIRCGSLGLWQTIVFILFVIRLPNVPRQA
jgi:hypothetical protein